MNKNIKPGLDGRLLKAIIDFDLVTIGDLLDGRIYDSGNVDINARDFVGWSALMTASAKGWDEGVKFLLERGADVNAADEEGMTSLMLTLNNAPDVCSVMEILISHNADVKIKNESGRTAFDLAMEYGHLSSAGRLLLLTSRLEDVTYETRLPAVFWLCKNKRLEEAKTIAKMGLDMEWKDVYGRSGLQIAVDASNHLAVETLIAQKADVNAFGGSTEPALITAVRRGDLTLLQMLLQASADVMQKNKNGQTALMIAAEKGDLTSLELLRQNGSDITPRDTDGISPLMSACSNAHEQMVQYLIGAGADLKDTDNSQRNALHYVAIGSGSEVGERTEIFKLLISHGADCDTTDQYGDRPHETSSNAELRLKLKQIWQQARARNRAEYESQCQNKKQRSVDVSGSCGNDSEPIAALDVTITPEGGCFRSESIVVTFPPGSLSESVNVQVQLYVDTKLMPVVDESLDEYIVSPFLVLEPHGLRFKRPVQVHFPFSVNGKGWHLSLKRAMCEKYVVPKIWEPIVTYDTRTEQLKVHDCDYDLVTGTLSITHFCCYHWIGWVLDRFQASKNMQLSIFGYATNPSMTFWNLTVYCHHKCTNEFEKLKKLEHDREPKGKFKCFKNMAVGRQETLQFHVSRGEWKSHDPPKSLEANQVWKLGPCGFISVTLTVKHDSDIGDGSRNCIVDVRQGANYEELIMPLELAVNEISAEKPTRNVSISFPLIGNACAQNNCDRDRTRRTLAFGNQSMIIRVQQQSSIPNMVAVSSTYDYSAVRKAVILCAPDRWFAIGTSLGYNLGQINSIVDGIPSSADRLEKIIRLMEMSEDLGIVAQKLLKACEEIAFPVIAKVLEKIHDIQLGLQ